nr:hypothetical protein Iba_scaffold1677729CG0010 [Ipomoea batatas]
MKVFGQKICSSRERGLTDFGIERRRKAQNSQIFETLENVWKWSRKVDPISIIATQTWPAAAVNSFIPQQQLGGCRIEE